MVRVVHTVLLAVVKEDAHNMSLVAGVQEDGHSEQPAMARAKDSHQYTGPQPRQDSESCSSCCRFVDQCEPVKEK